MNNLRNELTCPITLEIFKDPVSVPCCGKAFEREALAEHLENNGICPLCNGDLYDFNANTAPKNVVIAGLVESIINSNKQEITMAERLKEATLAERLNEATLAERLNEATTNTIESRVTIDRIIDDDDNMLSIGEINLSLKYSGFTPKPCLLIIVLDKSGSMAGIGWNQVQTALQYIVRKAKSSVNIIPKIIAYDGDAQIIDISGSIDSVERTIMNIKAGGSTDFNSAFKKTIEVMKNYTCDENNRTRLFEQIRTLLVGATSNISVSNVVITFMTDGDGNGPAEDMLKLPGQFKEMIKSIWNGTFTVHSVGFGKSHNYDFLESLRRIGTMEGVYRYSDYGEDGDTLCGKLTSIFDIVSASINLPITLTIDNQSEQIMFPVDQHGQGTLTKWIPLTSSDVNVSINIKNEDEIKTIIKVNDNRNQSLYKKWTNKLVDDLATDILEFSSTDKTINKDVNELHYKLLLQRGRALSKVSSDNKLEILMKELDAISKGEKISRGKLNDMRFDNLFSQTKSNIHSIKPTVIIPTQKRPTKILYLMNKVTFEKKGNRQWNESIRSIAYKHRNETNDYLENSATQSDILHEDRDGNNSIMWAAYRGSTYALRLMLTKVDKKYLDNRNKNGHTALSLAINNNRWKAAKI